MRSVPQSCSNETKEGQAQCIFWAAQLGVHGTNHLRRAVSCPGPIPRRPSHQEHTMHQTRLSTTRAFVGLVHSVNHEVVGELTSTSGPIVINEMKVYVSQN